MQNSLNAPRSIPDWWPWGWVGVHIAIGALWPIILMVVQEHLAAVQTYTWGEGIAPMTAARFITLLYAWMLVVLAGLLTLGIAQWLLLRFVFASLRWWAVLTGGSGVLAGLAILSASWLAGDPHTPWRDLGLYTLVFGIIGAAQWLELRRAVPQAGWWVGASIVGTVAFWLTYGASTLIGPVDAVASGHGAYAAVALAAQGGGSALAYAAITALAIGHLTSRAAGRSRRPGTAARAKTA